MAGVYVDTSALGRVLLAEPDATMIRARLASYQEQWSSGLVTVELGRLGKLHGLQADAHGYWGLDGFMTAASDRYEPPKPLAG